MGISIVVVIKSDVLILPANDEFHSIASPFENPECLKVRDDFSPYVRCKSSVRPGILGWRAFVF